MGFAEDGAVRLIQTSSIDEEPVEYFDVATIRQVGWRDTPTETSSPSSSDRYQQVQWNRPPQTEERRHVF
jgi:hypothetical protein